MKELSQFQLFIVQERETQESEVTCQGHSPQGTQDKSDTDTCSKIKIYDDKRRENYDKHPREHMAWHSAMGGV